MKLNYIEGSYNISFFNIDLNTEEELTQDVIDKNKSTFNHEFIHYLQDLILPYNIRLILSKVRWFSNILEFAHKHNYIIRPFDDWNDESKNLIIQFLGSIGNGKFIDDVSSLDNFTSDYKPTSGFDSYLQKNRSHNVYTHSCTVYKPDNSDPIFY